MDDLMQLGGNIELLGFKDIDGASMVVLKKIIGNYVRRFSEVTNKFEKISVAMKPIDEESKKFEIDIELINDGKPFTSEVIEKNLFIAVDNALKKIESQIS